MKYFDVLQNAIETFGEQNQTIVAIEELSELQKELTKFLRGHGSEEHLAEEMADVQIVFDQIEIMHGNRGAVAVWQAEKASRLATEIQKARGGNG